MHFVPLLGFALALALVRRQPVAALIFAQLLFGVKEDVLMFTVWTCAFVLWRDDRRLAVAIAVLGAVNLGAYELYEAPRSWAERAYPHNLIHYNRLDRGGHFAAWEQPQLFSEEIRASFRPLRNPAR